jgi:serine/threonine protein kinase
LPNRQVSGSLSVEQFENHESVPEIRRLSHEGVVYRLGHQVALGGTSTLFGATDEWGNDLVVKRYRSESDPFLWKNEVENLQRLRHPLINYMHAAFEHGGWRYIVLERWGVALRRVNAAERGQRELICRLVARDMTRVLHFFHVKGYVHGDMNSGNVLLRTDKVKRPLGVKLCDLALCASIGQVETRRAVAQKYITPECIDARAFGGMGRPPQDIYQAALILLEVMLKDEMPSFGVDEVVGGEPQRIAEGLGTPLGAALAQGLATKSGERPTAVGLWRLIAGAGKG